MSSSTAAKTTPFCLGIIALGLCCISGTPTRAAIVAPPWSNPSDNPCATLPGGWQLLYWAPLKKCFKIFTKGFPCPDTMELSPIGPSAPRHSGRAHHSTSSTADRSLLHAQMPSAECRCAPGTALSDRTGRCHTLFEREPCEGDEYFAPLPEQYVRSAIPRKRVGQCKAPGRCARGAAFWPPDGRCYAQYTRGPCARGKLVRALAGGRIAECVCENGGEMAAHYYAAEEACYELYTRGPCESAGQLFQPGGQCGCTVHMPHYDEATDRCYEIGTIGPCSMGHIFQVPPKNGAKKASLEPEANTTTIGAVSTARRARCQCKDGYVPWSDGRCYRQYTRGPCADGEFVLNATTCLANPCAKGRLYFPGEATCYRIGTQGPCNWQQVVVFDFTTRPSLDGISYNGVCGCTGLITNLYEQCSSGGGGNGSDANSNSAASDDDETPEIGDGYLSRCAASGAGMVEMNGECYKLYSRGPCGPGQWLEPLKLLSRMDRRGVQCACRPDYTKHESPDGLVGCYAPSVSIARYLNGVKRGPYTFGFRRIGEANGLANNTSHIQ